MIHNTNVQFLFLGGILGELLELPFLGNYFQDNIKIIQSKGCLAHRHTPSSFKTPDENTNELQKYIYNLFVKHQKPIIIYAHSKAALDILFTISKFPNLIKDGVVQKVIMINGSLYG